MSLDYSIGSGARTKYRVPGTNKYVSRSRIAGIIENLGFTLEEYYAIFIAKFKRDMFNNIIYPKCPQCGKKRKFYKLSNPYPNIHCGKSCRMKREQNDKNSFWKDEDRMKRKRESARRGAITFKIHRSLNMFPGMNESRLSAKPRRKRWKNGRYSKISYELFSRVSLKLKYLGFTHDVFYGDNEYVVTGLDKRITSGAGWRFLDFYCPFNNIVIEFNGDYWHGGSENLLKDISREFQLMAAGFNKIIVVKECDYISDKEGTVDRLVDTLIKSPESHRIQFTESEINEYFRSTMISENGEVSYSYRNSDYTYIDNELVYDEGNNKFYRLR